MHKTILGFKLLWNQDNTYVELNIFFKKMSCFISFNFFQNHINVIYTDKTKLMSRSLLKILGIKSKLKTLILVFLQRVVHLQSLDG